MATAAGRIDAHGSPRPHAYPMMSGLPGFDRCHRVRVTIAA